MTHKNTQLHRRGEQSVATKKLTEHSVEEVASTLRALPAPKKTERNLTKLEAIRRLAREIRKLQARGYKLEDIAEHLNHGGIEISANMLSTYLGRVAPTRKNQPKTQAVSQPSKSEATTTKDTPAPPGASPAREKKGSFTVRPDTKDI